MAKVDFSELAGRQTEIKGETVRTLLGTDSGVRKLNEALFRDNGLDIVLSPGRLCPLYQNRLDYVMFMAELTTPSKGLQGPKAMLDVGTGHTAVYILLALHELPGMQWAMGTDIDAESLELAEDNLRRNAHLPPVLLEHVDVSENAFGRFSKRLEASKELAAFTMCNPPFYSSLAEMDAKRLAKAGTKERTVGHESELVYPDGGELGFVRKLVRDSYSASRSIRWFSSLVGNYSSVKSLCSNLAKTPDLNWGVHEFVSGQSAAATKRWILFWSHTETRRRPDLCNCAGLKTPDEVVLKKESSPKETKELLEGLEYRKLSVTGNSVVATLPALCWTRAYRRGKREVRDNASTFEVRSLGPTTHVYWLDGPRFKDFESFAAWMARQLR